ncbi:MAG: hypothetical protein LUH23_00365 [Oscillospiraceae bacterium]|nr:hypothetical protein [Oscillospiraceae bacterium]
MKFETPNLVSSNIDRIGEMFPNCLTEAVGPDGKPKKAINFEVLKQMLSSEIVDGDEA